MGLHGMLGYWAHVFRRSLSKKVPSLHPNWPDELFSWTTMLLKGQLVCAAKANAELNF